MKKKVDILFLLKKANLYGGYTTTKNSGLHNAVNILKSELIRKFDAAIELELCVDANEIDKFVTKYKPSYCIIEALWVTPKKMAEITKLHKNVLFITRIHSRIPFLSQEGNAIGWLKEINKFNNSYVSFNNKETNDDFEKLGITGAIYLPNVYKHIKWVPDAFERLRDWNKKNHIGHTVDISSFGSIRPLKNQLIQAVAAMEFANNHDKKLRFHINSTRLEQNGDPILKNLRSLFVETHHELIEHPWLEPKDFNALIKKMDVGMQVSFSESFNIVTADTVYNLIPVVVSPDISWVCEESKVRDVNSTCEIAAKLENVIKYTKRNVENNLVDLDKYNKHALRDWAVLL